MCLWHSRLVSSSLGLKNRAQRITYRLTVEGELHILAVGSVDRLVRLEKFVRTRFVLRVEEILLDITHLGHSKDPEAAYSSKPGSRTRAVALGLNTGKVRGRRRDILAAEELK